MNTEITFYDSIDIPVFHDRDDDTGAASQKARRAGLHYYIIHQQRFQNSQGKPFALACIYPQSTYIGYYYETLDEAMFTAQLCEWHALRGDEYAQECILDHRHFGNVQSKQAYDLLLNCEHPELVRKPYTLEIWGKYSHHDELFFQPTLEEINEEIIGRRKDWRDLWVTHLPPDPLHLIQMEATATHPTIDWTATIVRIAATVAIRHDDGWWWSHLSDIERLLRYQQIPFSEELLKAYLAIWIWEHPTLVAFGESRSVYAAYDDSLFCWQSHAFLSTLSVVVPACSSCGKSQSLHYYCSGFSYSDSTEYVSKSCPFDGYGCQLEDGKYCFQCCRCRAIRGLINGKATGEEIRVEITRQMDLFAVQGGSPLRTASK